MAIGRSRDVCTALYHPSASVCQLLESAVQVEAY